MAANAHARAVGEAPLRKSVVVLGQPGIGGVMSQLLRTVSVSHQPALRTGHLPSPSHRPLMTSRGHLLALLAVLSGFNQLDRQLTAILLEPIRLEFALSDVELALLSGLAFALL